MKISRFLFSILFLPRIITRASSCSTLLTSSYDVIIDAMFGFSFHGTPRAPFDSIISTINASSLPVVSIDIPSGWDVERGDINECSIHIPEMLISLTTPKLCAQQFKGTHYVGGRFLPPTLASKYNIVLPEYPGCEQCVRVLTVC